MHVAGTQFGVRKCLRAMMLVALIGVFSSAMSYAQSTYGSLTGQVTDPTGAAVVGANVSLANVGTGFSQVEKTDSSGVYLFKLVPPGNYSLKINPGDLPNMFRQAL